MSGMWDRTLVYLGLREEPDDAYDEQHAPPRSAADPEPDADRTPARSAGRGRWSDEAIAGDDRDEPRILRDPPARSTRRDERSDERDAAPSNVTRLPSGDVHVLPSPRSGSRAQIVTLTRFDEVEQVGRRYRSGEPVVLDLAALDAADARRVLDVVAGFVFALRGRLDKVGGRAFLLVPSGTVLSTDEQRRLRGLGYRLSTGNDA
jgi:cell division inhibitor SepF